MNKLLAQKIQFPGVTGFIEGPLNKPGMPQFENLASLVNKSLTFVFAIAGILLLLYLIWGGFDYLTSMGDPKKVEAANHKLTSAIIGIIIIFLSYWVMQLAQFLLKI